MFGFFRRPAIVDIRPACGTWRVGELAICIFEHCSMPHPDNPRIGDVLRVTLVEDVVDGHFLCTFLSFAGKASDASWSGNGFRKAVTDETGASDEIARRIKAARPVRLPERVS